MFARSFEEVRLTMDRLAVIIRFWNINKDLLIAGIINSIRTLNYLGPNDLQNLKNMINALPPGSATIIAFQSRIIEVETAYLFVKR